MLKGNPGRPVCSLDTQTATCRPSGLRSMLKKTPAVRRPCPLAFRSGASRLIETHSWPVPTWQDASTPVEETEDCPRCRYPTRAALVADNHRITGPPARGGIEGSRHEPAAADEQHMTGRVDRIGFEWPQRRDVAGGQRSDGAVCNRCLRVRGRESARCRGKMAIHGPTVALEECRHRCPVPAGLAHFPQSFWFHRTQ